ncbi:MAG TPA: CsbD family protein [Chloroflexota bacterium]|jgi:uncharacterized protein YjbJ (UPF0337 family)|nr:CsbD family protein [Chloroflexota bacterium]
MQGDEDIAEGAVDKGKGRLKKAAGDLTGNERLRTEGPGGQDERIAQEGHRPGKERGARSEELTAARLAASQAPATSEVI